MTLDLTADLDVSSLEVLDYSQPANAFISGQGIRCTFLMMENEGDEDGGWPAGPGGCVPMCQLMLLLLSYAFVVAGIILLEAFSLEDLNGLD